MPSFIFAKGGFIRQPDVSGDQTENPQWQSSVMPQKLVPIGHLITAMQPVICNSFSLTAVKPLDSHVTASETQATLQ
jgi:hypothetical protein